MSKRDHLIVGILVGMVIGVALWAGLSIYGQARMAELQPPPTITRTPLPTRTVVPTRTCPELLYKPLPDAEGIEDGLAVAYEYLNLANRLVLHKISSTPGSYDPDLSSASLWIDSAAAEINEAHAKVVTWQQLGALTCPAGEP